MMRSTIPALALLGLLAAATTAIAAEKPKPAAPAPAAPAQPTAAPAGAAPSAPASTPVGAAAPSAPASTPAAAVPSAPASVAGEPRLVNGARFGAWAVACEAVAVNETACILTQKLIAKADNRFLAEMVLVRPKGEARVILAARVPIGVHFPSGFVMKPEKSEERSALVWQSCNRDICEAAIELSAEKLAELETGGGATAGYRPNARSEPVVFRIAFEGAGQGLDSLQRATLPAGRK